MTMQSFTQATIVKSRMTIRRERMLPAKGDVVARVGQIVSPLQVVARMPLKWDFHILHLSESLRISPAELRKQLLVKAGDKLEVGTPLVAKKGLFGKAAESPIDGELYRVGNGRIVVRRTAGWLELRALMKGRVVSQAPGRGVAIEADGAQIECVWGSGKEAYGELKVVGESENSVLRPDDLTEEYEDKMMAVGVIDRHELLDLAVSIGIKGIIAGGMAGHLFKLAKDLPIPVLVTDAAGNRGMARPVFDVLRESEGRELSMFGIVDLSLGERPTICIPVSATPTSVSSTVREPIAVGQKVRIVRAPYGAAVGEVVRIYKRAQMTNLGIMAYGADVKLFEGKIVFVPYANIDSLLV